MSHSTELSWSTREIHEVDGVECEFIIQRDGEDVVHAEFVGFTFVGVFFSRASLSEIWNQEAIAAIEAQILEKLNGK